MALPQSLIRFRAKYGFWPHREIARVYYEIGLRLASEGKQLEALIAYSHAIRVWPNIINAR